MRRWLAVSLCTLSLACSRDFRTPSAASATPAQLTAVAGQPALAPTEGTAIAVQGGVPPYSFAFTEHGQNSGPDAQIDAQGAYRAGSQGPVIDQLRVGDSAGNAAFVTISVGPRLTLSPLDPRTTPGGQVEFSAAGGKPPYAFRLLTACPGEDGSAGATLATEGAQGHYRAGPCGGVSDAVLVSDALGVQAGPSRVDVGPSLAVLPADARLAPGQALTLQASGGAPPYRFRWARHGNLSAGALTEGGLYQAGINPDVLDRVEAVDAAGAVGQVTVAVGDPEFDLAPQGSYQLYRANLNGDAYADLVAVSTSGVNLIQVFLGSPGGLVPGQTLLAGGPIDGVTIGDINNDGLDDLLYKVEQPDPTHFELLLGRPDGSLAFSTSFPAYDPVDESWELDSLPVVVPGPGGNLLAFLEGPDVNGTAGHSELLLLAFPPGGPGAYPTELGPFPLQQAGAVPLDHVVCPANFHLGAGAGGLVFYDQTVEGGSVCDQRPGSFPLTWIPGLDAAPDGGLAARAPATLTVPLCQTCADPDQGGRLALGVAQFAREQASVYLAQTSPYVAGQLTTAPLLGSALGSASQATLPLAGAVEVSPPAVDDAGPGLVQPALLDLVGDGPGARFGLVDGGWAPVGALPGGLTSASAAPFTGGLLSDLATVDPNGRLRLRLAGVDGQFGQGGRFAFLGQATAAATADLDGDGASDLLLAARSLQLWSGTPGGLATEAAFLPGAHLAALQPGQPGQAWGLITSPVGGSLLRVHPAEDGGAGYEVSPLPASAPQGRLAAVPVADGGLELVLSSPGGAGGPWAVYGLDAQGRPVALAQGLAPDAGAVLGLPPTPGGPHARLAAVTDDQIQLLAADGDGGYAPAATFDASGLPGDHDAYYFDRVALAAPPQAGQPPSLLAGTVVGWSCSFTGCTWDAYVWARPEGGSLRRVSPGFFGISALAAADLDGDGNTDLLLDASVLDTPGNAWVGWGDGAGHFEFQPVAFTDQALAHYQLVIPGDFDGDGHLDLAFVLPTGVVSVLHGDGQRGFH